MIKPEFGKPIDAMTMRATVEFFEDNLKILHPFMPFLTEEIWHYLRERTPAEALIISEYPTRENFDPGILEVFELVQEVVSSLRTLRKEKNIAFKEALELYVVEKEPLDPTYDVVLMKLCNVSNVSRVPGKVDNALSFRVHSNEYFVPIAASIDLQAEIGKLKEELAYQKGFLASVQKKLSNERFVSNAPEKVISNERKKEADALAKIAMIEESLQGMK